MPQPVANSRHHAFLLRAGLVAAFVLAVPAAICLLADEVSPAEQPVPDPLPIRRVLLPADRLAAELERARRGVLVQLPRDDFEARVRKAAQAGDPLKNPPRLVEARYRATLTEAALTGTAEWKLTNPSGELALLSLQPLTLAVRQARWPDSKDAVLGDLNGSKELQLLVEAPGEQSLFLDWSARGNPIPGGLRFSLDVPACAVASLEIDLPADREITASPDSYLVSGPHQASGDRRAWRIGFAGRSQVNFVVRRFKGANLPVPLVLSRLQTRQELTPGQLQSDFDFDLEVRHGAVKELTFEATAGLRPYEVTIHDLEGWEFRPGPNPNAAGTVLVRLREPFQGGAVQVRCLARLGTDKPWVSPGMRLLNGVSRGESLVLRVHPELQLLDWRAAGFRLTQTVFQQDGWHILTLGAGLDAGASPERPSARLQVPGAEYRTRQQIAWYIGADSATLVADIACEVVRGRVLQIPIQLPLGWEVEAVESSDLVRAWNAVADKSRTSVVIDLQRALESGAANLITVRARLATFRKIPADGVTLPLPDVTLPDARFRASDLQIYLSPQYQATASATVPPLAPDAPDPDAGAARPVMPPRSRTPWGKQVADFLFRFRGQPVAGTLQLRSRAMQLRARCSTDIVLASGRAVALVRLELHPEVGAPAHVDLFTSGHSLGRWEWKTVRGSNAVRSVDRLTARDLAPRLASLAACGPLQLATLAALPAPEGEWWRITFAQPLTETVTVETAADLTGQSGKPNPAPAVASLAGRQPLIALTTTAAAVAPVAQAPGSPTAERRWEVPLVGVPRAYRLDGRVTLHLAGTDLVRAELRGLQEVSESAKPHEFVRPPASLRPLTPSRSSSWRSFRYGPGPMALVLHAQTPDEDRSSEALVDRSWLTTVLDPSGRLVHHFRFHIWNWRQHQLPVRLPAGAQVLAASTDGRWLSRLPAADAIPGGQVMSLPVLGDAVLHRFEIVYATELSPWTMWTRLEAPAPELPVRSLAFRRVWRLPGSVEPVAAGTLQRMPGSHANDGLGLLSSLTASRVDEELPLQRQAMSDAVARFRKLVPAGQEGQLGNWLENLALNCLRDQPSLLLDTEALREASALAITPVRQPHDAMPFWETVGLVYVPCRAGPLLTSRERLAAWRAAGQSDNRAPRSIEDAVANAAHRGHDISGRFRTVNDWLRGGDVDPPNAPMLAPAGLMPQGIDPEASGWEPMAGAEYDASIVVVREGVVPIVGLAVALVLVAGAKLVGGRLPQRWQWRLLLAWVAVGGLALLWLPVTLRGLALWPVVAGVASGLLWCLGKGRVRQPARSDGSTATTAKALLPATGAVIALAIMVSLPGQAAPPAPTIVYLVPAAGSDDKQAVLAPPELLDQLQALTRRGAAGLRGAVLLSAAYEGRADNQAAQLEARFWAHSFTDETTTVLLPLSNVQLIDALLDGAAAQPVAVRVPREGYTVDVKGRGLHRIIVRFSVPLPGAAEDRELRLGIPELVRSRLKLDVPTGAGYLQAVEARGAQRVTTDEQGTHLEADLGAVSSVRVRWRRDGQRPRPATISVKEAYYWDLHASSARLLAVLDYAVTKGWETHFQLELPRDLEVLSAEAAGSGGTAAPPLKEWLVKEEGGSRRLVIDFVGPVTGNVQVTLEMMPRQPFGPSATLPFPSPIDAQSQRGFLAYHADGLDAVYADSRGITGIKREQVAEAFAQEFGQLWKAARQEDLRPPTLAYSRVKGGTLVLTLKAPQSQARGQQDVTWRIEPRQASVRATARLTAPEASLSFVEWDVPGGISVTDVSGPLVRTWSRAGGRVQVWLQRPTADLTLTLQGWLPRLPNNAARFDLPCLRLQTRTQSSVVRVLAGDGLALQPQPGKMQYLTPRPDLVVPNREWGYVADQENYSGIFQISPASTRADFRLLTFVEVRNRQLTFVSTLDCQVQQGELRQLHIGLRNWEGSEVQLDAVDVARRREQRLGGAGRSWTLDLQPGVNRRYQLTLTGSVPLGANPEVSMPDVRVDTVGADPVKLERWLAVSGPELLAEGAVGLVALAPTSNDLQPWPRDAERLRRAGGLAWKVTGDDWRLRLRSRLEISRPAPVQVFLTEHAAAVADGRRWTHTATYWLYHEAGADLSVGLPVGASILSVTVDGLSVPPLQPGAERLWLPLAGGAGARVVRLRWAFPEGQEPIDQPFLTGPRLEGVVEGPVFWTVHVPAGYQTGRVTDSAAGSQPASAAALNLWRAAVQLQVASRLIERARDDNEVAPSAQLRAVRQRFDRLCRQVEYELAAPGASATGTGPNGQNLSTWLIELRDQFRTLATANAAELAKADASEGAGAGAESSVTPLSSFPFALAPFERGLPTYWQAPAGQPAPRVHLIAATTRDSRDSMARSALLVVLVLALWIVAHFFRAAAWPEQLVLFGCVAAVLFSTPFSQLFLLVVMAGLIVRLVLLTRWLRTIWQQPPPAAAEVAKPA
jgi:hypothetical protein